MTATAPSRAGRMHYSKQALNDAPDQNKQDLETAGSVKLPNISLEDTAGLVKQVPALQQLRSQVVGHAAKISTPFGKRPLVYMDWAASGRLLQPVETFMTSQVAPWYANVHSEVGHCANITAEHVENARAAAARFCSAPLDHYAILFEGAGMTGAVQKLAHLLGIKVKTAEPARIEEPADCRISSRPKRQNSQTSADSAEKGEAITHVLVSNKEDDTDGMILGWNDRLQMMASAMHRQNSPSEPALQSMHVKQNQRKPVVFFSMLEHHSNCVFWREMDCHTVCIPEDSSGLPDLAFLEVQLKAHAGAPLMLGSFTSGSNVTGIAPNVHAIARMLHMHGALAVFDFASAGASVPVRCMEGVQDPLEVLDAVLLSPHKFAGGPGGAGVLVVKRDIIQATTPLIAGGGTVNFVLPDKYGFVQDVEHREAAGTPNITGIIRTGLALEIASQLNVELCHSISSAYAARARNAWSAHPSIRLMGSNRPAIQGTENVPILSFNIVVRKHAVRGTWADAPAGRELHCQQRSIEEEGGVQYALLHPNFVSALLNDVYGIQSRSGCACAGPYTFTLVEPLVHACGMSGRDFSILVDTPELPFLKPGFCRVYFSHFTRPAEVKYVIRAVMEIAQHGWKLLPQYDFNPSTGTFIHTNVPALRSMPIQHLYAAVQGMIAPDTSRNTPVDTKNIHSATKLPRSTSLDRHTTTPSTITARAAEHVETTSHKATSVSSASHARGGTTTRKGVLSRLSSKVQSLACVNASTTDFDEELTETLRAAEELYAASHAAAMSRIAASPKTAGFLGGPMTGCVGGRAQRSMGSDLEVSAHYNMHEHAHGSKSEAFADMLPTTSTTAPSSGDATNFLDQHQSIYLSIVNHRFRWYLLPHEAAHALQHGCSLQTKFSLA